MTCKFFEMIKNRWNAGARVCVGLDPDMEKIPQKILESASPFLMLNKQVIEATKDQALCYKINPAYYRGSEGFRTMRNTVAAIHNYAVGVPIIYDGKFGDGIAKSNQAWAKAAFDDMHCEAVTVQHLPGKEAMMPFLEYRDKGIFVLCRTSGEGSEEFQDSMVEANGTPMPMYQYVAHRVKHQWNYNGNCGLVVGATKADELYEVRRIVGTMPILMPGFGSQQADVHDAVLAGTGRKSGVILPSSSSKIMFAYDPKAELTALTDEINAVREKIPA